MYSLTYRRSDQFLYSIRLVGVLSKEGRGNVESKVKKRKAVYVYLMKLCQNRMVEDGTFK